MIITQSLNKFINKKQFDHNIVILVSKDYYKPSKDYSALGRIRCSSYFYQLLKNDYKLMEKGKNLLLNYRQDFYISSQRVPKSFTLYKKMKLLENVAKHNGELKCEYCKINLPLHKVTFDHIIPQASGGRDWKGKNLYIACEACNRLKGCIHPIANKTLFKKFIIQARSRKHSSVDLLMSLDKNDFIFYLNQQRERIRKDKWAEIVVRLLDLYTKDDLIKLMKESKTFYSTMMYAKKQIKKEMVKKLALAEAKAFVERNNSN
jgi:5-methylcytosine-specific restriction endonuclease McrA